MIKQFSFKMQKMHSDNLNQYSAIDECQQDHGDEAQRIQFILGKHQKKQQRKNMQKQNFLLRFITFSLLMVFFIKELPVGNAMLDSSQLNQQQLLKIANENQKIITLQYRKPYVYRPEIIEQPSLKMLKLTNQNDLQKSDEKYGSSFEFGRKLYMNWFDDNQLLFQAEYYRLNQKYNLDSFVLQKGICIMAPFRNLMRDGENGSWKMFLKSLNEQNYSNYRVYMMDDFSSDNSTATILKEVPNYPRLNNRLWIIKNKERIGALGNRDSVTRNFCQPGQIVMDIDGDDALIGKQALNLFNRFYTHNESNWFVYTNFLAMKGDEVGVGRGSDVVTGQINPGPCQTIREDIHKANTYRTTTWLWSTSQLRSYYRDLYMKIPLTHLLERGTGKYFIEASDRFTMYALAELAGPNHTKYFPQFSYFYYEPNYRALETLSCTLPVLFKCEYQARILTPLKPLKSLREKAQLTQNYHIPQPIMRQYVEAQRKQKQCREKLNGVSKIFSHDL